MKHFNALLLKFLIVATILEIVLRLLTSMSFASIILIALTLNFVSYAVGDLFILSISNNTIATAADFVLSLVVILLFNIIFVTSEITFVDALIASSALAVCEWMFHKFMARVVLGEGR